jgi:ABC-type cobalamin transport system ATPase subunit
MSCKTIRLTKKQREKLDRLGGGEWVRTKINAAPEPA